jgi:hypothetical protein
VIHRIACSIEYAQWLVESGKVEVGEYESAEITCYVLNPNIK